MGNKLKSLWDRLPDFDSFIHGRKRKKTPVVLQMEAAECGAASLGIILGYYKKYMPLERLRELCGVSRNGSNAGNVMAAAETLGMKAEGFSYAPEDLKKLIPPFIIHWEFHHFLVFEGFDEKHPIAAKLTEALKANFPEYLEGDGIKWNFTKFLIDREGNVVARFEPNANMTAMENQIKAQL